MTKEELEKEAIAFCNEVLCSVCENKTCTEHLQCREWRDRRAGYYSGAEPREKRIAELEAQIEEMKSQYDYVFNQLCESREIVCLMLSQYKNKKEIDYSAKERGEKLLKEGVYKNDQRRTRKRRNCKDLERNLSETDCFTEKRCQKS